jgi:hypothetical protein
MNVRTRLRAPGRLGPILPRRTLLPVAALLLAAASCRGDEPPPDLPVSVRISVAPTPPVVGPGLVVVEIHDLEGNPVEGAEVRVEGLMTHAGMVPVTEEAVSTGGGRYRVEAFPFEMGGDWILRVHLLLPTGEQGYRDREIRVVSGPPPEEGDGQGAR